MKTIDILRQKHTVLMTMDGFISHQGVLDYTQTDLSLYTILVPLSHKFKDVIGMMREEEYHSNKYNDIKENMLPVWFVGGTFPQATMEYNRIVPHTDDTDILTYSNLLCIDIDNQEIDRHAIFDLPYVIAVLRSSGGSGYYVLILVEDGIYTKEYYSYLARLFKSKFNIEVDQQCKNIGRKRVLSYEDDIEKWIKPFDYEIKPWKLRDKIVIDDLFDNKPIRFIDYKPNNSDNTDFTRKAIWKLLDSGFSIDDYSKQNANYGAWYYTACEFANFEDGYDMFVRFSQNSSKYNDDINTINNKWHNADKSKTNIDDVNKKWCGICKNRFGSNWWRG